MQAGDMRPGSKPFQPALVCSLVKVVLTPCSLRGQVAQRAPNPFYGLGFLAYERGALTRIICFVLPCSVPVAGASESKSTSLPSRSFKSIVGGTGRKVALVGGTNARHTPCHL